MKHVFCQIGDLDVLLIHPTALLALSQLKPPIASAFVGSRNSAGEQRDLDGLLLKYSQTEGCSITIHHRLISNVRLLLKYPLLAQSTLLAQT